jgi:hypothetical protein
MGLKAIFLAAISLTLLTPSLIFAGWSEPELIISGSWGKGDGQFDKAEYDTDYNLPDIASILPDGTVLIHDTVNWKMMVFKENGELLKEVFWQMIVNPKGEKVMHLPEYWIIGVDRYTKDGNIIIGSRNTAKLLSPSGELLVTYDTNPLEMGIIRKTLYGVDGSSQHTVEYEDNTYNVTSAVAVAPESFVRDAQGYLYAAGKTKENSISDKLRHRVFRFDLCGRILGFLDLPEDNIEEIDLGGEAYQGEYRYVYHAQYGPPVIGPGGSIYAWKRTPDTYSILKWDWVDDPSDPQGGPEPPANLAVQESLDGLLLTWGASPQDPGCVDSYEVERATSSDGIYSSIGSTDAGILRYNDPTILPGETVYYKVRAKSGGEYSDYTAVASGKRP